MESKIIKLRTQWLLKDKLSGKNFLIKSYFTNDIDTYAYKAFNETDTLELSKTTLYYSRWAKKEDIERQLLNVGVSYELNK